MTVTSDSEVYTILYDNAYTERQLAYNRKK